MKLSTVKTSEPEDKFNEMRCGGLVVNVPATRSAHPGFESRPGGPHHRVVSGLRGGRSLCEYCTNKL